MRGSRIYMMMVLLASMFMMGCQRIELYELTSQVNIKFNMNLQVSTSLGVQVDSLSDPDFAQKINGTMPEYMEVLFYNQQNRNLHASYIIPTGGATISITPGNYHLVAYNFGTESTQVENIGNMDKAEAFTSDITKSMADKFKATVANASVTGTKGETRGYEDDPIIYEPDHLYVAYESDVHIPSFHERDDSVYLHATASSVLDIYSLEVLGVKGAQNVEKVEAFITGQVKSNYFGKGERSVDPATLYITLKVDLVNEKFYTVFGTFGKLPNADNNVYLDITVTNTGGGQYRFVYDITDQFEDKERENRLVIRNEIDIPEGSHGGGGLAPEVDEWGEEIVEIPLM